MQTNTIISLISIFIIIVVFSLSIYFVSKMFVSQCPSDSHYDKILKKCIPTCAAPLVNGPNGAACQCPNLNQDINNNCCQILGANQAYCPDNCTPYNMNSQYCDLNNVICNQNQYNTNTNLCCPNNELYNSSATGPTGTSGACVACDSPAMMCNDGTCCDGVTSSCAGNNCCLNTLQYTDENGAKQCCNNTLCGSTCCDTNETCDTNSNTCVISCPGVPNNYCKSGTSCVIDKTQNTAFCYNPVCKKSDLPFFPIVTDGTNPITYNGNNVAYCTSQADGQGIISILNDPNYYAYANVNFDSECTDLDCAYVLGGYSDNENIKFQTKPTIIKNGANYTCTANLSCSNIALGMTGVNSVCGQTGMAGRCFIGSDGNYTGQICPHGEAVWDNQCYTVGQESSACNNLGELVLQNNQIICKCDDLNTSLMGGCVPGFMSDLTPIQVNNLTCNYSNKNYFIIGFLPNVNYISSNPTLGLGKNCTTGCMCRTSQYDFNLTYNDGAFNNGDVLSKTLPITTYNVFPNSNHSCTIQYNFINPLSNKTIASTQTYSIKINYNGNLTASSSNAKNFKVFNNKTVLIGIESPSA